MRLAQAVKMCTVLLTAALLPSVAARGQGYTRLLYVSRNLAQTDEWRIDQPQATTWGSNLFVRDLRTGTSTPLITQAMLPPGVLLSQIDVQSPELSFDATKVLFSGRLGSGAGWNVYEIDLRTRAMRRVTPSNPRNARGELIDDELMPAYLPDGDIVFVCNWHRAYDEYDALFQFDGWVRHNTCTVVYRCRADGSGVTRLSQNQSHDLSPSLMRDGRILHSFWLKQGDSAREVRFPAWTIRPDGSGSFPLFGDHGDLTALIDLVELPDGRIAGINGFFKGAWGAGEVVIMHPHADDFEDDYQVITPGVPFLFDSPAGRYRTPRPTPDGRLLVSWSPTGTWFEPAQFGIYVMNLDGSGKTLVTDDPTMDELDPIPIVPYSRIYGVGQPDVLPAPANPTYSRRAIAGSIDARFGDFPERSLRKKASAFSPSEIVAVRVLAGLRNRTRQLLGDNEPEVILGEVPLQTDGSFRIDVPANVPYHLQGIDASGLAVVHETSWQFEPPGKTSTCGGCHAHQSGPAPNPDPIANHLPPVRVGPGAPTFKAVEFERDVAPILQAKCAGCHHAPGSRPPDGGLDLATDPYDALLVDLAGAPLGGDTFRYVAEGPIARRYVTTGSANESFLVWKLFGHRLDGRASGDLSDDVDYRGVIMPPPTSGLTLTDAERRTIIQWIDSGARRSVGWLRMRALPDSDQDGIPDIFVIDENYPDEWIEPLDPAPHSRDGDGDGISDSREDPNRDGVVDAGETDPMNADTDGDGFSDGYEVSHGSDPVDATSVP